jgi:hypothetical protein
MNGRILVILLAVVVGLALISQSDYAYAGNKATAKPAISKTYQTDQGQYKNTGRWLNSLKAKYYRLSKTVSTSTGWFTCDWGLWWQPGDSGGIEIIRSIYDYEDYTHIYIEMNENKE